MFTFFTFSLFLSHICILTVSLLSPCPFIHSLKYKEPSFKNLTLYQAVLKRAECYFQYLWFKNNLMFMLQLMLLQIQVWNCRVTLKLTQTIKQQQREKMNG